MVALQRGEAMSNAHGAKWIRPAKRRSIYDRDGHHCVYCGACGPAVCVAQTAEDGGGWRCVHCHDVKYHRPQLTLDHLHPRELGGTNDATNLVTACFSCNSARQDKGIRAWFAVLRKQGVNTGALGARIRRLVRKPLDSAAKRLAREKRLLASFDTPVTLADLRATVSDT